jgi:hypothetical protein
MSSNTAALGKAGKDIKALEKSISELRGEVVGLKQVISGLDLSVRSLEGINRKIHNQKTEK